MTSSGEIETVKCKSCGAPANMDSNRCEYCGSYFHKEEDDYESDGEREAFLYPISGYSCVTTSFLPLHMMFSRSC